MTEHVADQLSEYLDGDLAPESVAAVEAHLGECASCRTTLVELRQVLDATALLEDLPPANDLWPAIRARIEQGDDVSVLPFRPPAAPHQARRFSFSMPQLAAAATLLMLLSGGAVWMLVRPGAAIPATGQTAAAPGVDSATTGAAQLVSAAVHDYDAAIRELQAQLDLRRSQFDATTITVVEQNLRVIDAAIAEARAALARDPANAYLYRHLDETLTRKVDLLRHATTLRRVET